MFSIIKSQDAGDFEPTSPKMLNGKHYTVPSPFLTLFPGNVATLDTRSSAYSKTIKTLLTHFYDFPLAPRLLCHGP